MLDLVQILRHKSLMSSWILFRFSDTNLWCPAGSCPDSQIQIFEVQLDFIQILRQKSLMSSWILSRFPDINLWCPAGSCPDSRTQIFDVQLDFVQILRHKSLMSKTSRKFALIEKKNEIICKYECPA